LGKGNIIKASFSDLAPTLPNIPTQVGLQADQYEISIVPADDLDKAVAVISQKLMELRRRFPAARVVADYTGGTKTMTAALVMAALEAEEIELCLVTGARADLLKVHDGTQRSMAAGVEGIRLRRAISTYLDIWQRFGYGDAAQGLAALPVPREAEWRAELQIARDLSLGYDAWDRFDHAAARQYLDLYRYRIGQVAGFQLMFLDLLAAGNEDSRKEPAQLLDLWLNAERRAVQGRYDDAVARVYRLLEWTAQWLLRTRCGLDTSDIRESQQIEGININCNREGKRQAGLVAAWQLVAHHLTGSSQAFARQQQEKLRDHIQVRNQSILAHGYRPVDKVAWERLAEWVRESFLPMLHAEAAAAGVRRNPPQLPRSPIWRE
jgi:CRISPR-associated protein (TIGR02710 family)